MHRAVGLHMISETLTARRNSVPEEPPYELSTFSGSLRLSSWAHVDASAYRGCARCLLEMVNQP